MLFNKYSEAEKKMFTKLGYKNLDAWEAISLYSLAAREAFIGNKAGPEIEALRRGTQAIFLCSAFRLTQEFDNLISF